MDLLKLKEGQICDIQDCSWTKLKNEGPF